MLTIEERTAAVLALHVPEQKKVDGMLYSVWEDGEITLEKDGNLFGQRRVHRILSGDKGADLKVTLPVVNRDGSHSRIFVRTMEEALQASALLGNKFVPTSKA